MAADERSLIENALAAANQALAGRFSGAACAFVSGSIIRGQGTTASDIDIIVIFDHLENAWREAFIAQGFPVEAFVHDPETLSWFITQDVKAGYPVLAHMIATGQMIGHDQKRGQILKDEAVELLAGGPPPLTGAQLNAIRYEVTDLTDDLRGQRTPAERRAIIARLYQPLADLVLLGRGAWSGKGKWIPRQLEALDPQLADAFDQAFHLAANGDGKSVLAFAEAELARHGGSYFAGDKRMAPPHAREVDKLDRPRNS